MNALPMVVLALMTQASQAEPTIRGVVRDAGTGGPVAGALVELLAHEWSMETDPEGGFVFDPVPGGSDVVLRVSRIGYVTADTVVDPRRDTRLTILLEPAPVRLEGLLARGYQLRARTDRELFEDEVQPGLVGLSRRELTEVPAMAEVDVLRALQALPSVIPANDLDATLHVMGGGADQNLFLWDGARVFAPYHMFGVFGAFSGKAVDGVEFHRGALPARYGGAVSSVVDLHQRAGGAAWSTDGTLGMLAASFSSEGRVGAGTGAGGWHASGRRSTLDLVMEEVFQGDWPYSFHDASGTAWLSLRSGSRVRGSFFHSRDRFDGFGGGTLSSGWRNRVISGEWVREWGDATFRAHGSWSAYDGFLDVGVGPQPRTADSVGVGTLLLEWTSPVPGGHARMGTSVDVGGVELRGSDGPGAYVEGADLAKVLTIGGFLEGQFEVGAFRFAPGLRLDVDEPRKRTYVQPRLSARAQVGPDVAITTAVGSHVQLLSAVRDGRNVLPGAPLWLGPAEGRPAQRSDALSISADAWLAEAWSIKVGTYARRLTGVPDWRPAGARTLDQLAFSDGHAIGLELMARRSGRGITGWLAYGLSRVTLLDSDGQEYAPRWDRRHGLDAALFLPVAGRGSLSGRVTVGSGTPFWPFLGYIVTPRLHTIDQRIRWGPLYEAPYWATEQARMPPYFRLDVGAHFDLRFLGARFRPFVNVLNVTGYPNVLYYQLPSGSSADASETAHQPVLSSPIRICPSLGLDVSF